jgi:hypothetical protein
LFAAGGCTYTLSASSVRAILRARSTYATRVHTHIHTVILLSAGHLACSLDFRNACAYTHSHCQLFCTGHLVCSLGLRNAHAYTHTVSFFIQAILCARSACSITHTYTQTRFLKDVCCWWLSSPSVQAIWRAHSTYATRVHTHTVIFLSAGHLACSLNLCNACAYTQTHCHLPQCRPSGVLTQPMQRVCIHTWTRILNGRCCWWTSASHGEGNVENPPEQCKGQLVRWSNHTYAHTCCMHMLTHVYVPVH